MGIERSDDLNSLLTILVLENLSGFIVIEISFDENGFHGPLLLELCLILTSPRECSSIFRGDVNTSFAQRCSSIIE